MTRFLTEEWIREYQRIWNANSELKYGLRKISATMKYFVTGDEQQAVFVRLDKGEAVEAGKASNGSYDYVMWATADNWKKIAAGEVGPKTAMATRKLNFKGSMLTAMRYIGPFGRALAMMSEVETKW